MSHSWRDRFWHIGAALIMMSVAWELLAFMAGFTAGIPGTLGVALLWSVIVLAGVGLGAIMIIALMQRVLGVNKR